MLYLALSESGLARAVKLKRKEDQIVLLFPCAAREGVLGAKGIVKSGTITPSMLSEIILHNRQRIISLR